MSLYLHLSADIAIHNFDSETESTSHLTVMKSRVFLDLQCMCALLLFEGDELPCYDRAFIISAV